MTNFKSLKRVLGKYYRYAVTVKDTDGFIWVLLTANRSGSIVPTLLCSEDGSVKLDSYLVDKKTFEEILKRLKQVDDRFWTEPLEDCEEGQQPTVLLKNTLETLTIGFHYGSSKLKL